MRAFCTSLITRSSVKWQMTWPYFSMPQIDLVMLVISLFLVIIRAIREVGELEQLPGVKRSPVYLVIVLRWDSRS